MTASNFSRERTRSGVLNRAAIAGLIDAGSNNGRDNAGGGHSDAPPLVAGYVDLERQLQPNGFDLTLRSVARFGYGPDGRLGVGEADRRLPDTLPMPYDYSDWWVMDPGAYLATFNEIVSLPRNLMALCHPRTTLLRSGVALHTGVWDAGYRGRGQALLTVHHPFGWRAQQDARIAQLVFLPLSDADADGYAGTYQHDGV